MGRPKKTAAIPVTDEAPEPAGDVDFGGRMRFLRQQRGLALEWLAGATGLTKSHLSKIERRLTVPSINSVLRISRAFGVTVGQMLGEETGDQSVCVVRADQRHRFVKGDLGRGWNYEALAAPRTHKAMEPLLIRPAHFFSNDARVSHPGEEFLHVLDGELEVELPDRILRLAPGDSLYFDCHVPHRIRSVNETPLARVLAVLYAGAARRE
ncbi:XRE family transcriptional regulator [Leptolyngbya sp. 15MV]|nr:XRE family transcriptional regulator [Leptolyngbya sp. 15MV]